jgi:hypothetical protein
MCSRHTCSYAVKHYTGTDHPEGAASIAYSDSSSALLSQQSLLTARNNVMRVQVTLLCMLEMSVLQ